MPEAANAYGDIFGGWIVAHADLAGGVRALECARGRVATVAINHFRFHEPVFVGDLVSFYARVTRTGKTSITVAVEVFARRHPSHQESVKVTEGVLTYVAVDDSGRPRPVPRE
jgi:acyl-CoA thioesterase YciA